VPFASKEDVQQAAKGFSERAHQDRRRQNDARQEENSTQRRKVKAAGNQGNHGERDHHKADDGASADFPGDLSD